MNHSEVVESQALAKYLLGELSVELREEYEEHFFSCPECSRELSTAAEFLAASRQVLSEAPVPERKAAYVRPAPSPRFSWLNPWLAGPVLAGLLALIAYQNLVTIPRLAQSTAPQVLPMYSLITANTRGEGGRVFSVAPGQPFGVYVDVPVEKAYSVYLLRLESPRGSSPLRSLTAAEAQKTQVVTLHPDGQAGKYAIVISGLPDASANPSSATELARLEFTVAIKDSPGQNQAP
jgi:hypothetical protein